MISGCGLYVFTTGAKSESITGNGMNSLSEGQRLVWLHFMTSAHEQAASDTNRETSGHYLQFGTFPFATALLNL